MVNKPRGRAFCKDCPNTGKAPRPAPYPGPRCATHHRERRKDAKAAAHEKRVQQVYGLAPGEYEKLYFYQGGKCAICQRARGISRKLAVDHDHETGLARGLLCGPCNKIIGQLRDDVAAVQRLLAYLVNSPARRLGVEALHEDFRKEEKDG